MATMTHDAGTRSQPRPAPSRAGGLALALVAAASFGLSGALVKGMLPTGWSTGAAVLVRVLLAVVVLLVPAVISLRGRWELLWRNRWLILTFGVVAVAGCQWFYFQAVARMQIGVALLIEYVAPLAVVAWLWMRHSVRPAATTLIGAAVAVSGLVLVLDLFGGVRVNVVGAAWALGAMLGTATYFVIAAQEARGLPPLALAASGLLVGGVTLGLGGVLGLVPMSFATDPVTYGDLAVPWWVPVLLLGVVTSAISYSTGIAAGRRLGSRLASFVALLEVVAALVFAWALLGELPRPVQIVGGALILTGVVVVKRGEGRQTTE